MRKRRMQRIARRLRKPVAAKFGRRLNYSPGEIESACLEKGLSAADDIMLATILFGSQDLAQRLAKDFSESSGLGNIREQLADCDPGAEVDWPDDADWF